MSRSAFALVVVLETGFTIWLYEAGHVVLALLMIGIAALTGTWFRSAT